MRNALVGLTVAATIALIVADVSVFGIAFWKIALAAAGGLLFVTAGVRDRAGKSG